MRSSITISLLALALYMADAAKSTTKYSTETVFLPQRKTGSATNIYASLITETGSKTEYLLACQTNFGTSYSCDGDFHGITVTYEESSMHLAVSSTTYDCSLGSGSAVCATITATQTASVQSRTIPSSESELWMTPITFVDLKKRKTTSTKSTASKATETASNKLCKRKIHHGSSGSDSGDSGSSGSSGSSGDDSSGSSSGSKSGSGSAADDDDDSESSSASPTKKKNHDDDGCSAGSITSWSWGIMAVGFGGFLGVNMV
ncbi:hypothetical protein NW756_007016 [Fusarium oxysporum]|nr:hypothetical protein NW753_012191 [Fusarium oxysporum]KAJ4072190.1 hypothetical protein NW763_001217 [Fusarium oxysporum]KAJ4088620.1 hypothetical protein NW756_007016 [Fusarium oxysporum]KAJ4094313.1 hypothetical protein NW769_011976 [Fusarium oxysporum]KAJ4218807.1 hypothetical protein NW760_012857 [Fusarium oxysporum]